MAELGKGLAALTALKTMLNANSSLEVIHEGGYKWEARFIFHEPAKENEIIAVEQELSTQLPNTYRQFLRQCNGAILYYDSSYGQWGFHLYGTEELAVKNKERRKPYGDTWPSSYLIFAESLGDADLLILEMANAARQGKDCRIVDGDSGYLPEQWRIAAPNFESWLDRLVVAQGAKFWRWY